ncbi:MAG: argininosuccinate lyase [Thermotoga caldifontis]|uniref:argininosuccinate lyase n=1 Tax=Thermotoga caldifontis TaxID=1508419 RepID=UPI003C7D2A24
MRFSKTYKRIVLDSSFKNWQKLSKYYMWLNKAHLLMLYKTGIVPKGICSEIAEGLRRIENERIEDELPEGIEDFVFLIENKLSKIVGIEKAGFLHTARSRNDIDATVFRMCVRDALMGLSHHVIDALIAIVQKAKTNLNTILLLYTHGQPAQVSTLAHFLLAFGFDVADTLDILVDCLSIVNTCPMGSCAITTTGFPIDRVMVSDYLGFSEPIENSYRAIVTSHWVSLPSSCLKILMNDLTRFVQEIVPKSSCEVGIFQFPDDLVQVSSIMPQKRNPVVLEHIRLRAGTAHGIFDAVEKVFLNTPYQDINENGDHVLFEFLRAVRMAEEVLLLFREVVQRISVDQERVKELSRKTGATTTELADELVRTFGISFRQAHTIVSQYVSSGMKYDVLCETFEKICGRKLSLSEEQIERILSPEHFVEVRKVLGGPHERSVNEAIERLEGFVRSIKERTETLEIKTKNSLAKLEADFRQL